MVSKKKILKTIFLPEIFPRLRDLLGSGHGFLAYLLVTVYNTVKIIPSTHPYLKPGMRGRYSVRQALAVAADNIQLSRRNIDQVLIFFGVIAAMIIMVIQFILMAMAVVVTKASAQEIPDTIQGFFVTPNPKEDIAFRMLDLVFGLPDFFGSKAAVTQPIHSGLHAMLEFYSYSMLIVGAIIILYYVVAVVAETAQSGAPFGQRFNKAWAPIRIILFFALLIPLSHGLNAGQYITLTSAKLGSGLASQGWIMLVNTITKEDASMLGVTEGTIAVPRAADLDHIPSFMLIAKTCQKGYNKISSPLLNGSLNPNNANSGVKAWVVFKDNNASSPSFGATISEELDNQKFQDLIVAAGGSDIRVVFGIKDPDKYKNALGNIEPLCGSMILRITSVAEPGVALIQDSYFDLIKDIWKADTGIYKQLDVFAQNYTDKMMSIGNNPSAVLPNQAFKDQWNAHLQTRMGDKNSGLISDVVEAQIKTGAWNVNTNMTDFGWGGAGIWYNKIAQQNGALVSALRQTPMTVLYPRVMERIKELKIQEDANTDIKTIMRPIFSAGSPKLVETIPGETEIGNVLSHVYAFWEGVPEESKKPLTLNPIIDTINMILGTSALFEICENVDVHPLAQLSSVGKSMLDNAIIGFSLAGATGIASILPTYFGPAAAAASSFFGTIASVGLLVGFILFYVIPFYPFLYFFFAVGKWIKGIFEAVVAMPLWAIAHLRIDGDGIAGEAAIAGYYLIFEIFIRPILIVFGFLAAITVFAAMVKVLNETFYLAISNLSGHDPKSGVACLPTSSNSAAPGIKGAPSGAELNQAYRGPVDEFFFTVLYTIIVYLVATTCFKLIDTIPNQIMTRWMGTDAPSFNDESGDVTEGLLTYISLGGSQFGSQIAGSFSQMRSGASRTISSFVSGK